MKKKIFAIITDFGFDFSVASMKALILRSFLDAQIVDIDHSIKQFSILSGAFVINKVYKYFPKQTIFICIVDPGVGSEREPICIDIGDYKFIGPNNGLFHFILKDVKLTCKIYEIKEKFISPHSNTFHGRDLFTPAAIELAKDNYKIISPFDKNKLVFIPALEEENFVVVYIDGFGNIKTNIPVDNIKDKNILNISVNGILHKIKFAKTFSDAKNNELLCYKGSNNTLEIAANLASAKDIINVNIGDYIAIKKLYE